MHLPKQLLLHHRGIPKNDFFNSPITHPRDLTLRRERGIKGSKGRRQSEDLVKKLKLKDVDGDFQHHDSSIRRSGRRKGFSWTGSSSGWSSVSCDSSRKPRKHLTFASSFSKDEKTDEDQSTLFRSRPSEPISSARRGRSTTRKLSTRTKLRYCTPCESPTNRKESRRSHRTKPESTTALSVLHRTTNTTRRRQP